MSLKRRMQRQIDRAAATTRQHRAAAAAGRTRAELVGLSKPPRDNTVERARLMRALKHAQGVFATAAAAGLRPKRSEPAGSGGDNTGGRP